MPLDRLANLDDLDVWSDLEGLDVYGSIDNLNIFFRPAEASLSIEVTSSANESTRVKEMSASVGAVGFSSAKAIAFNLRSGFAEIVVNASALEYDIARTVLASPEINISAHSNRYLRALSFAGNSHLDVNASGGNTSVRQCLGGSNISINAECEEMFTLGSNWEIKQEGSERWGVK